MSIRRESNRSFVLQADREGWVSNLFAKLVRSDPELEQGRAHAEPGFTATLLELTPDRHDALQVRFDFAVPFKGSRSLFITWDGERFVELDLASLADGETRVLADTSDVLAMMTGK